MILLDTDHLTVFAFPEDRNHAALASRLRKSGDLVAVPVIAVEESLRGWMARINRERQAVRQVAFYEHLASLVEFLGRLYISRFDIGSAEQFNDLVRQRIRIGTLDLKIAAIALANQVRLLSNNLRDFRQVPGLRVESWLDEGEDR